MQNVWGLWACAAVVVFGVLEAYALLTHRATLSHTVWRTEARWPLFSFLAGGMIGGVAVHFFGWNPSCNP